MTQHFIPLDHTMIVWDQDEQVRIKETQVYYVDFGSFDPKKLDKLREKYGKYPFSHGTCCRSWTDLSTCLSIILSISMSGFSSKESKKEFWFQISKIKEFEEVRSRFLSEYVSCDDYEKRESFFDSDYREI